MLRKLAVQAFLVLGLTALLSAQTAPPGLDPSVKTGTLANGVRYFIQANPKPENRVELRLTIQAGSVQETEKELGLAHLVEHLAFEGTDRFGAQEIIRFLEASGMKFGNDLNASTNFTETQYFLEIPADQPETLVTGLKILEDWAHGPKVTADLVEKEKKIVAEEERVRMENVQGRLTRFYLPLLFAGTPYADRMPIGKMEVLAAVTPADVRRFVDRWYVPRALSLQIVGAIDPAAVEAQLKKTFTSTFANAGQPPAPAAPEVPVFRTTTIHPFQDPDLGANILVWNKIVTVEPRDVKAVKELELLNFVVNYTLSKRFTDLTQNADPAFLQAAVGASPFQGKAWLNQFQLVLRDGQAERSLEVFLTELKRAAVHGLTPTDLALALGEYRSQTEALWNQRGNITHNDRASALAAYAVDGTPVLSDEADYRMKKEAAAALTLDRVNAFLKPWLDTEGSRLLVLSASAPGTEVLTADQIRAVGSRVAAAAAGDQVKERTVAPLFPAAPAPGKVVKTETVPGTSLTRWVLSNGLTVQLYRNDFTKNEVQLRALAPGGLSLVSDQDYPSAVYAPYLFSTTGLGDLDTAALTDFLAGHQVGVNAGLDDTGASVSGSAVPADLEILFQMVHKKLSAPRRDPAAEASFLKQVETYLKNQQDLPNQAYQNEMARELLGGAPRSRPITAARIGEIVPDRAARLYAAAFAGGAGFTFTVTGDYDEAVLKPLVETYLASLPGGPAPKTADLGLRPLPGPLTTVVKKGQDNKAVVTVLLPVPAAYSAEAFWTTGVLQEILDIRMREVVRQDKEGTYGVSVDVTLSPLPYPNALTQVNFTCDRTRQDELLAAVRGELKALAGGAFSDEVFSKAVEIRKRDLETSQKTNGWWNWAVALGQFRGDALQGLPGLPGFHSALKKDAVAAQARLLLDPARALTVILNPEEK